MWGKLFSALFCLLLLSFGVSSMSAAPDWYDPRGSQDLAVKALAPPDAIQRAEAYGDLVQRQDLDGLRRETHPAILNPDFYKGVAKIAIYGSLDKPVATRILGYHTNSVVSTTAGTWTDSNILIAHYYSDKVIFMTTYFHEQDKKKLINGFNLRRLSNADIASLKFSMQNKSPLHYGMLGLAALILVFSLITLYVTFTRPRLKWRWLWVFLVMFGIGRVTFNWATAAFGFDLVNFRAPQVIFDYELLQPMIIAIWLPIGAVLFWFMARQKTVAEVDAKKPQPDQAF